MRIALNGSAGFAAAPPVAGVLAGFHSDGASVTVSSLPSLP